MKLKVKRINYETGATKDVIINVKDAAELGTKAGDRVIVKNTNAKSINGKSWVAILQIAYSDSIIKSGQIGIFIDTKKEITEDQILSVKRVEPPDSFKFIKKKVNGKKLSTVEINSIVSDSVSGLLSSIELASFITGVSINGMDNKEMTALTHAEARSGEIFDFGPNVYDKHST
jgi:AMP phosphorylase